MKMEVTRHKIKIKPETMIDDAYIEDTLGLKEDGDFIYIQRKNVHGLGCVDYLVTEKVILTAKGDE